MAEIVGGDVHPFKYKAFLSYSRKDDRLGRWLQSALEAYRIPADLVGTAGQYGPVPARLAPIFRDREELSAAQDLPQVLHEALANSGCLIVLCTPHSALSKWVNEEILAFRKLEQGDRTLAVIGGGEPGASLVPGREAEECYPPALLPESSGNDRRGEPLAADFRNGGDGRQDGKLKLIAGVLGIAFDTLKRREEHARRKRLRRWIAGIAAIAVVMAGLAGLAYSQMREAQHQRAFAVTERDRAETALRAANAAASGLAQELAAGTKNWPGVDKVYINRMLIRAQNVLLLSLTAGGSDVSPIQRSLAIVYSGMSDIQEDSGNLELANTLARDALRMFKLVYDKGYDGDDVGRDIAIMYRKIGTIEQIAGHTEQAAEVLREGLAFVQEQQARRRDSLAWQLERGITESVLGRVLADKDDKGEAIQIMEAANKAFDEINPTEGSARYDRSTRIFNEVIVDKYRAQNEFHLGRVLTLTGQPQAALTHLLNAESFIHRYSTSTRDGNYEVDILRMRAINLRMIAIAHQQLGNVNDAQNYLSQTVFELNRLVSLDGKKRQWIEMLARTYELSAATWIEKKENEIGRAQYAKAEKQWEWLMEEFQNDPYVHIGMARLKLMQAAVTQNAARYAAQALSLARRFRDNGAVTADADEIIKFANEILSGNSKAPKEAD